MGSMSSDKYCDVTSGPRGQKVVAVSGRDDSSLGSYQDKEAMTGGAMGGSATSLAHSLTGASAVQRVKGEK